MPKHKLAIYNPKINEYIYDRLSRLTDEQKNFLSSTELHLINDDSRLRTFITWTPLDKKLAILTKVGISWNLVIYQESLPFKELMEKVYKQYSMKNLRLQYIEEMRAKDIFVMGNKQIAISLSMLAQNCHSDVYFLNSDFIKISNAAANANSSKKQNPLNSEYAKSEDAFSLISKIVFEAKMAENYIQAQGLEMVDAMILYFLYSKAKTYTRMDAIQRALGGSYTERTVYQRTLKLFEHEYIDKFPSASEKASFTITAKGVMFVGRVLQRIVNTAVNG